MKIIRQNMKSCFTCQCADTFILPYKALYDYKDVKVKCVADTTEDKLLAIGGGCPDYEPCCTPKIILKES